MKKISLTALALGFVLATPVLANEANHNGSDIRLGSAQPTEQHQATALDTSFSRAPSPRAAESPAPDHGANSGT